MRRRVFGIPRTAIIVFLSFFYSLVLLGLITYILVGGDPPPDEPSDFAPTVSPT